MSDPAYLVSALRDVGVAEAPGPSVSNPRIDAMYSLVGHPECVGKDSEVPWCAAFDGSHLKANGYKIPPIAESLRALAYDDRIGRPVSIAEARRGDVARFTRGAAGSGQGHVGFVLAIKDGGRTIELLSGNQGNAVTIKDYSTDRLVGIVRPARSAAAGPVPEAAGSAAAGGAAATAAAAGGADGGTIIAIAIIVGIVALVGVQLARRGERRDRKLILKGGNNG